MRVSTEEKEPEPPKQVMPNPAGRRRERRQLLIVGCAASVLLALPLFLLERATRRFPAESLKISFALGLLVVWQVTLTAIARRIRGRPLRPSKVYTFVWWLILAGLLVGCGRAATQAALMFLVRVTR